MLIQRDYDGPLFLFVVRPAASTYLLKYLLSDSPVGDHRQARMFLQTELPSSKAKREQALRSILAARRRQILSQRPIETRNLSRAPRPADVGLKDSSDVLEAQETKHGMYVTSSTDEKTELPIVVEPSESSSKIIATDPSDDDVDIEFVSKEPESGQVVAEQQIPRKPSNESIVVPSSIEDKPASFGNSRSNYSIGHRNSSSPPSTSPTTSSLPASGLKAPDTETRKKNIVSMPESLYNYFRPVESNIPVEDMSQFLYFGQKIQPETQNSTGNNSVEATPTVPIASSSRRRYSMKRTTTPVPVPQLEEIINEEMNIAVEKQIVEKNKVSKIKNAFRSPENGVYYRKPRPTDPTIIVSNVIATKEAVRNTTDTYVKTDDDQFRDDNQSAHAATQDQLRHERGSVATHVPAETRNATNSTQIPSRQPVSANPYNPPAESEIKARQIDPTGFDDTSSTLSDTEMYGEHTEHRIRRIDVYDTNNFDFSRKTDSTMSEQPRARESNNIETSTSRDKIDRSTTEPFRIVWTSPETSTLRIIVTEGSLEEESFAIGTDAAERYTVKPVDSTEERVRSVASGDVPTASGSPAPTVVSTTNDDASTATIEVVATRSKPRHREQKHRTEKDKGDGEGNRDREQHRHQEQQQQHVYAYTITNVTRLLRNYTGPGLSNEEGQGGPERGTGTTEITTGSAVRRQPPSPPQQQSLLLLPRAGSGIEAARAPAELSAGTTVEAVAAGVPSAVGILVGETQKKVVTVAAQPEERTVNSTAALQQQLIVNKSKATEVTSSSRGAVRWNHTKARNTDLEGIGDRRFLRKSASAVLNQRIGGVNGEEDALVGPTIAKRRRLTNGQPVGPGRRVKGGKILEEGHFNDRPVNGPSVVAAKTNSSGIERSVEDAVEGRGFREVVLNRTIVGIHSENMTGESDAMTEQRQLPSTTEVADVTTPRVINATEEEWSNSTEPTITSTGGYVQIDTKDKSYGSRGENESVPTAGSYAFSVGDSAKNAENSTVAGSSSSTVTVTATVADETLEPKETTPTTTTTANTPMPAPVFPVTPRIITETARAQLEKETFTVSPTESVSQTTDVKTTEPDKPFGMSNLDPSEIQKMYRSKNVTATSITTETPTTPTTAVQIEISTIPQDQSTMSASMTAKSPATTTVDPRKRVSGERSPEVRARNLSDKSKDKDDVLPIMQLYNTSDIFNGSTGQVNSFSRGTERRVELPVDSKPEISRTTEKVNDTVTTKSSANDVTTRPSESTRKDKHDENRETSTHVPPTGPGRGSTNGSNRTRHRPVYHPAILPEYNVSVYPNELNRTFFETGLISVSPRESVNVSEVISKRHDGDAIASQETVAVVSYILATLVVFPIAVGVGLILRRLILRNRKVLEESDTSSEISCRKDALNLENGDFKTSIEKAITKLPRIQHLCHEAEKPPPPSSQESRWEFPRDKLRLQTVLGQGNFGQVWKAEADDLTGHQGTTRLVAVKTVKEGASDREKEDLVRELEIMQQLGSHPNVVTLLGCCTEQEPHYLILEYVMYGKLLTYLRDHRTRQDFYNFSEDSAALTSRDLTVFGYCVARGMEYLASKKIIHRDLAARNVLVDHNKLCKIADFGMSRFANEDGEVIETRHGRNALPIRWMAPESLIYSLFTTKTDVWSFGILMWEIVTLGSTPYPDMTAREVMRNVQNGYRLERPSHCRTELFRVISRCWQADPDRRPEFQTLRRDLAQLLEDNMNGHYVDLESFASECTD
ncbi:Tyrosine kinase receptor Cad96Ca [Dufourea novaeangliae]|uniref:receptor protein-tyrosine kinase n=1 Tax=Dufourea novaeangliae TaxID=178035 RepID=A0A154PM12_DUFNO|nr:Tyrosine kinase receptor Cad96Ca [Dufourea novaeangliae]